jgi:hypothetical protein
MYAENSVYALLRQRLDQATFETLERAHRAHIWMWKYHRLCDRKTLGFLRSAMYSTSCLTLLRNQSWRVDRNRAEYDTHLAIPDEQYKFNRHGKTISGHDDPYELDTIMDMGPGNCTAIYEMARPGKRHIGFGDALYFTLDGTLRNCLREELRVDPEGRVPQYRSDVFRKGIKLIEIWSVAEFALGLLGPRPVAENNACPFTTIRRQIKSGNVVAAEAITEATAIAQDYLSRFRAGRHDLSRQLATATMLGFLIDEMVSRCMIQNAMYFQYSATHQILADTSDAISSVSNKVQGAEALRTSIQDLELFCGSFLRDTCDTQAYDLGWCTRATAVAEQLRREARLLRTTSTDLSDRLYSGVNAIYRWTFFLEQREHAADLTWKNAEDVSVIDRCVKRIVRWLQRPFGVITMDDLELAFRGLLGQDDKGPMPLGVVALGDFFQQPIDEFLTKTLGFKSVELGHEYYNLLITRRLQLAAWNHNIPFVEHSGTNNEDGEGANLIIDLFTLHASQKSMLMDALERDMQSVIDAITDVSWVVEVEKEVKMTRGQRRAVDEYVRSPRAKFQEWCGVALDQIDVVENIDVMPPEDFLAGRF